VYGTFSVILIHINYGEKDPLGGGFRVWYGIYPVGDSPNWLFTANGSIALGDLTFSLSFRGCGSTHRMKRVTRNV
jgi:hypothetical protein